MKVSIQVDRDFELDGVDGRFSINFAEAKLGENFGRGGTFSNKAKLKKTANNVKALGS